MSESTRNADIPVYSPPENALAALFESVTLARRALRGIETHGITPDRCRLYVFDARTRALAEDAIRDDPDAIAEIAGVLSESFSDDEKFTREIGRVLAAGGVLLQVDLSERLDERREIGSFLRSQGARAVYFWGALTTERL